MTSPNGAQRSGGPGHYLLFIFAEIAPVLFKMMTERGPYDDIVEQKKYEVLLRLMAQALQTERGRERHLEG